jgi:hypothetical protein
MNKENYEELLLSSDIDDVYDALIDVGKKELREYEDTVWNLLEHKETDVRRAAVMVLGSYWALPDFIDKLSDIWKKDKDDELRATALICWIGYFKKSANKTAINELKNLAQAPQESATVRIEALRGIVKVLGANEDEFNFRELERTTTYKEFEDRIPWKKFDDLMASHDVA